MQPSSVESFDPLSLAIEPGVRYCFDDSYIVDSLLIEQDPFVLARLTRPVFVTTMTPTVKSYNSMSMSPNPIREKVMFDDHKIVSDEWNIPIEYLNLSTSDIINRLLDRQTALGLDRDQYETRVQRVATEMNKFKEIGRLDVLRLMCYVVDVMTTNSQIWGVGRGSSVSSYVLFLIGVHDIDSIKYDLDFTDFVKI